MTTNIQKARARMMLKHPFYATLMANCDWVETREIPTAATDMKRIMFNPDFMSDLSVNQCMFVIAHEVMHIALEHGLRLKQRNPMKFNVAGDFAINLVLKDCGFEILEGCLIDEKWRSHTTEEIYNKLPDPPKQGGGGGSGEGGMYSNPMQGDLQEPGKDSASSAGQAKLRQEIQQKVAAAAQMARMAGKMPGSLEALVSQILEPAVPWPDILRDYMLSKCQDDETWGRRNRRFADVYLPTRHSDRMGEIVIIGDSSGSMLNQDDLNKMAAEINGVSAMVNPERLRLIWADTRVASEEVFESDELVMVKPAGGGGTDMRVPLRYVEQYDPDVVILITDGYTPWPDSVPYPLITVTTDAMPPEGLGDTVKV